jgi:carbon-monoxide dehydrogenase medium subunit
VIPASLEYRRPDCEEELRGLLEKYRESGRILAGGQALLPACKRRALRPAVLIDVTRIESLGSIEEVGASVRIGATVTYRRAAASGALRARCPLLARVAGSVGDPQVRSLGTLVGSLCEAHPSADLPAALVALEAEVEIAGPRGEKMARVADFIQGPRETALEPDEFVRALRIPGPEGLRGSYRKVPLGGFGYALAGVAALVALVEGSAMEIRLGVTGVGARPFRAVAVEDALRGQAVEAERVGAAVGGTVAGIEVLGDDLASAEYRAHLAGVLAARAILEAASSKSSSRSR